MSRPNYPMPDYYVTLYCQAASHADQPWIIGTWTLAEGGNGDLFWHYSSDQWLRGEFVRSAAERHKAIRVVAGDELLDLDTVEDRRRRFELEDKGARVRETNRLACHLCGDRVKRSMPKFQNDLKALAGAGIRDLQLRDYRAFIKMR